MSIRVAIVDDQALMRDGFSMILDAQSDIDVVGDAENGRLGVELCQRTCPDVVLMDFSLPGMNGSKATEEVVRSSTARVIGLSMHDKEPYMAAMRDAGASAWLTKGGTIDKLLETIRRVASGETTW